MRIFLLSLALISCKPHEPMYDGYTIIYNDDSACLADSLAAIPIEQAKRDKQGKEFKGTLDQLAKEVDRYIKLRDKSTDSVSWYRWEDSVKEHIYMGNYLLDRKIKSLEK